MGVWWGVWFIGLGWMTRAVMGDGGREASGFSSRKDGAGDAGGAGVLGLYQNGPKWVSTRRSESVEKETGLITKGLASATYNVARYSRTMD